MYNLNHDNKKRRNDIYSNTSIIVGIKNHQLGWWLYFAI